MILDAHSHLGDDVIFDCAHTEEDLLVNNRKYGITGGIVQPFIGRPYMEITRQYHDRIYEFCRNNRNYWGMASINPHFRHEEYAEEAGRCIRELGFIGLKLTPVSPAVYPDVKMVIAHLGSGFYAAQAIHLAQEYEQVYLEPSGCGIGETYEALRALDGKKVMFSSDSPLQIPTELAKYWTIVERHPGWEEDIFCGTACEVFGILPDGE